MSEALLSVRRLDELLPSLTDAEIKQVIALEEAALRRKSFLDKLYREMRQRVKKQFSR
jgi:hypothetical protein